MYITSVEYSAIFNASPTTNQKIAYSFVLIFGAKQRKEAAKPARSPPK
jgi:hypothetical protein